MNSYFDSRLERFLFLFTEISFVKRNTNKGFFVCLLKSKKTAEDQDVC